MKVSSQRGGLASGKCLEQRMAAEEQLMNNTDDLEEELRLASVCKNSPEFARLTEHLELLTMASAVKLGSQLEWLGIDDSPPAKQPAAAQAGDPQKIKNILVALDENNLKMPASLVNSKRGQAFIRFYYSKRMLKVRSACVLYITGKLISFSYLCFCFHKQAAGTDERVRPYVDRTCASLETTNESGARGQERRDETVGIWLNRAGALLAFWPGAGTVIYGLLATLPLVYYLLPQVLIRLGQVRADPLCFLLDPLGRRRRLRNDLNAIIDELMLAAASQPLQHGRDSFAGGGGAGCSCDGDNEDNDDYDGGDESQHSAADFNGHVFRPSFRPRNRFDRRPEAGDTVTSAANDRLSRIHYIQMLHQIRNLNLVQPYSFSSNWHSRAMKVCLRFTDHGLFLGYVGQVSSIVVYTLYELNLRTNYLLGLIECSRKWTATAGQLSANQSIGQLPDSVNDQYRDALMAHDGTWLSRTHLVLFFEVKRYLTPQMVLFFFELSLLLLVISLWIALFVCIFFLDVLGKVVWLKQIELQLRNCISVTLHQRQRLGYKLADEPGASNSPLKSLTISYLNYELFRRHNGQFKMVTNFIGRQVGVLTGVSFSLAYLVAVNIRMEYVLPALGSVIGVVFMMDVYLFVVSYQFGQTQKIMNMIACLLSHGAAAQMHSCDYAMQLWRRQLLTEAQLRQFYSSNLFGISVSYQKFILCNAYLAALIFITLNGPKENSLT